MKAPIRITFTDLRTGNKQVVDASAFVLNAFVGTVNEQRAEVAVVSTPDPVEALRLLGHLIREVYLRPFPREARENLPVTLDFILSVLEWVEEEARSATDITPPDTPGG